MDNQSSKELSKITEYMRKNSYICLQGKYWQEIWQIIPGHQKLPRPLILAGWWMSSDNDKKERFLLHISEADSRGVIEQVQTYLSQLPADAWYKA